MLSAVRYSGHVSSYGVVSTTSLQARRIERVRAQTSDRLIDAAVSFLRDSSFDGMSLNVIAIRAGVSEAEAVELFPTKDELIVEICLRRIDSVEVSTHAVYGSIARVGAQLGQMMLVIAEEPALAGACAAVFLDSGPAADRARSEIGLKIHRLIASAMGPGSWPEVIATLELVFSGALIQAAAGAMTFQRAAGRVQTAVSLILEGVPQD